MTLCSTVWDLLKCRSCWITNRVLSISCRLILKQSIAVFTSKIIMSPQKKIGQNCSKWGIRNSWKQSPATCMLILDLEALWRLEMQLSLLPETGQRAITQAKALILMIRTLSWIRALLCWCLLQRPNKKLQDLIQIWAHKWITRKNP